MKVFLSWSGEKSRQIATAFHDWLPYVIQTVKPFISTGDIDKGKRWNEVLASELGEIAYGVICITQNNFQDPWLNFEAGAISKAVDASYVSPFLFDVQPAQVNGPLQQFQFTVKDKEDIFHLITSINNRLEPEQQVTSEVLRKEFDVWWPTLNKNFDRVAMIPDPDTETGYEWLYSAADLAGIHTGIDCRCVWFITSDLLRNALTKLWNAIQTNLNNGVRYTFIIPASDRNDAKEDLKRLAASKLEYIQMNDETPTEEFSKLAVTDYLIVNADSNDMRVFLELPNSQPRYWIKVENKAAMGFVSRFRPLANKSDAA